MKVNAASVLFCLAGLASATPNGEQSGGLAKRGPGSSCNTEGEVSCWWPTTTTSQIQVCVNGKIVIQATCPAGTSCSFNPHSNQAWCGHA